MKRIYNLSIGAFLCFAFLLVAAGAWGQQTAGTAAQITTYKIKDLGTLGTGANSIPYWITDSGEVVGVSETGQTDSSGNTIAHAFRWVKGAMEDLGTLGGNNSTAFGVNQAGLVAGLADVTGGATSHAVVWHGNAMTDLGTLIGSAGFSYAQLVNDHHQVVGGSSLMDGSQHAVLWDRGLITDLGTMGGPNSFANGINERGQIVGGAQASNVNDPILGFPPYCAVLWNEGMMMNLGPGPNGIGSAAFNINNRTQVVGRFALPDPVEGAVAHPFLWQRGVMEDLGVLAGDDNSQANSLNDNGQVVGDAGVGFVESYSPDHALLWQSGMLIDLNTLIPADSGYQLIVAFDINARGEIVVCAVQLSTGNVHAALLIPAGPAVALNTAHAATAGAASKVASHLSENARRLLVVARSQKLTRAEKMQ